MNFPIIFEILGQTYHLHFIFEVLAFFIGVTRPKISLHQIDLLWKI